MLNLLFTISVNLHFQGFSWTFVSKLKERKMINSVIQNINNLCNILPIFHKNIQWCETYVSL